MGSCNRAACTSDSVWADCQIMNACQSWHERANCLLPLRMMTVMPLHNTYIAAAMAVQQLFSDLPIRKPAHKTSLQCVVQAP